MATLGTPRNPPVPKTCGQNGPVNPDQERLDSGLIRWHVCMREDLWKGECAPPHVLPHRYMHSQLEMMQTVCVHEGEHVERQACPSTHSPSHTHAWLQNNQH